MSSRHDAPDAAWFPLERDILALLEQRGALGPDEIAAALGMEDPDARHEMHLALRFLTDRGSVARRGKKYRPAPCTVEDVLAVLRRGGSHAFSAVIDALGGREKADPVHVNRLLLKLAAQKKVRCLHARWSLIPEIREEDVLDCLRGTPSTLRELLRRCQGVNGRKKELLHMLRSLEGRGLVAPRRGRRAPDGADGDPVWQADADGEEYWWLTDGTTGDGIGAGLPADGGDGQSDAGGADGMEPVPAGCPDGNGREDSTPRLRDAHFMSPPRAEPVRETRRGRSAATLEGTCVVRRSRLMVELDGACRDTGPVRIAKGQVPLLEGDRVQVRLDGTSMQRRRPFCSVVRIVRPSDRELTLELSTGSPLRARLLNGGEGWQGEIVIERNEPGARPLDRVTARVLRREGRRVFVAVAQVQFTPYSIDRQEKLARLNHGAPGAFPEACLREADALPSGRLPEDAGPRDDWRALPFVTMDGETARDYDDAIQVERGPRGWTLRVAIADVSLYVRPNSALDREALQRGNSWYFPTSMAPMLPERLCKDLCSLVPGRDRPVVWVQLEFADNGALRRADFGQGIIRSHARLTYDQAKLLVLDRDGAALAAFRKQCPEHGAVLSMLADAHALYRVLAARRRARGALDLDLPDTEAAFDGRGRLISLTRARRHDMHLLIEEFMIRANEAVADLLQSRDVPTLYRVHEAPSLEKTEHFIHLLRCRRIPVPERPAGPGGGGKRRRPAAPEARDLADILDGLRGTREERVFSRLCVRSMPRARYDAENSGHYGLASAAYCHFTSPIRRYADLVVHRALKAALGLSAGPIAAGGRLSRTASMLNEREKATQQCEREMNHRLAVMWMINQPACAVWDATVSGVTEGGCFVELDAAPVEGMLLAAPWRGLKYRPDDESLWRGDSLVARIGMRLKVRVQSVSALSLYINFMPVRDGGD